MFELMGKKLTVSRSATLSLLGGFGNEESVGPRDSL